MTDYSGKIACPCCGYKSLKTEYYGSYSICPICFWEDDQIQLEDPTYAGGANKLSLIDCQKNYIKFGACEWDMKHYVRPPYPDEVKDENWKPLTDFPSCPGWYMIARDKLYRRNDSIEN
jgi:Cysteine-rich CPCC